MNRETRGWTGADRAKPAEEVDIRYGHGLLKRESSRWPGYVLVSTPSAHRAAGRYLGRDPEAVGYVDLLDWGQLKALAEGLDVESAELVIGLGAGRALDASKYVALANDLPLVLVPSVVSTGAIIHALVARWDGRRILGGTADWAWVECEHVLIDYDLALEAPYYLNTGGLGDCLSGYSGVAEWRHNARNGVGPPVEEETVGRVLAGFDAMADEFPRTLDAQGRLTADSIHYISVALQERDGKGLRHPAAPAADHPFLQAIELVNDRGWVHGELAALGSVIVAWQCGESPETLLDWLDRCRVRRRPVEMGVGRDELLRALQFCPAYFKDERSGLDLDSIMGRDPVAGERFERLWEFLNRAPG